MNGKIGKLCQEQGSCPLIAEAELLSQNLQTLRDTGPEDEYQSKRLTAESLRASFTDGINQGCAKSGLAIQILDTELQENPDNH